jgi:hypothetical protein
MKDITPAVDKIRTIQTKALEINALLVIAQNDFAGDLPAGVELDAKQLAERKSSLSAKYLSAVSELGDAVRNLPAVGEYF